MCNRFIKLYGGVSNQFLTGNCGFDAYLIYFEGGLNGVKMCNINPKVRGSIIGLKMGKKLTSKIGNIIILSDFLVCYHAQTKLTNPENEILSQSYTTEKDLLTFQFWNFSFQNNTFGHFLKTSNFSGIRIAPENFRIKS